MWCFAEPERWTPSEVVLDEGETRHAVQVMRIREGASVHVLDGRGQEGQGSFVQIDRKHGKIELETFGLQPRPTLTHATLAIAVCKPSRWEWILEKSVELGLGQLAPLLCDHCVARPEKKKAVRWRSLLIQAAKQSHNAWIPQIEAPVPLDDWLRQTPASPRYAGALTPGTPASAGVLKQTLKAHDRPAVLIGPEGDFSPREYELLQNNGVLGFSFGPIVFRCETAAVYILSCLKHEIEAATLSPG